MRHLRLRFVVLVVAAAVVAGAVSQSSYAITWCFDWVAYEINPKKDTNPNRLTADQLRDLLRRLGYTPVLQIKATAPTAGDVVRWYDIKLDVSQLAPPSEKIDKRLKQGDVVIFSDDHAGIVNATRRPADARFDHFLQIPGKTGTPYRVAEVAKLPNYFVGPGKNWSLKQMFALSREKPPEHERAFPADDWTVDYYTERLGRLAFGAPRQYPFLHSTVEVWRRTGIDLTGQWSYSGSSAQPPWNVEQVGRKVTADWVGGPGHENLCGSFTGTFTSDDVVEGTFEVTEPGAHVKGKMVFTIHSADRFSWKDLGSSAPTGSATMVRAGTRKTSAAQPRCTKSGTSQQPPKPAAGSFVLTSNKVTNPNAPELTIDAAGGKALWNHTGQYGGAGKGGEWKVDYTFKVPQTLVAGKTYTLTLALVVSNVVPVQPLLIEFGARAPDFVGRASANYPNPPSDSKTFTVPLSAGYGDFKEIVIIVGINSAEVTYVYRRVGG